MSGIIHTLTKVAALVSVFITVAYLVFLRFPYHTFLWSENQGSSMGAPLGINFLLLVFFGMGHSCLSRPKLKKKITSWLPIPYRSLYLYVTVIQLGLLLVFWQPVAFEVWSVESPGWWSGCINILFFTGVFILGMATYSLGLREFLGLNNSLDSSSEKLITPFPYNVVRHPIYLGWILVHWFVPTMTVDRLFLAFGVSLYIGIGVYFEEKDLKSVFQQHYLDYQKQVHGLNPLYTLLKKFAWYPKYKLILNAFLLVIGVTLCLNQVIWIKSEMDKMKSKDPRVWNKEIQELKQRRSEPLQPDEVLFLGSSSIRFWKSIEKDLSPIQAVNMGFGGAKLRDLKYYEQELVDRLQPKKIVVFIGTNDLTELSPYQQEVRIGKDISSYLGRLKTKMPDSQLILLSITPTFLRAEYDEMIERVNTTLEALSEKNGYTFLNLSQEFIDQDGNLRRDLFKWDGLHLSKRGYQLWAKHVKTQLNTYEDY